MAKKRYTAENMNELLLDFMSKKGGEQTAISEPAPVYELPDHFGVDVVEDSGMVNTRIFVTRFSPSDVEDFRCLFKNTPPLQNRSNLESKLVSYLNQWCQEHSAQCPYEPFLWALKEIDNYVGSQNNNAVPQAWLLEAVGGALHQIWDERDPAYHKVLCNVLGSWEWYQPVQVMIYLYQFLSTLDDEGINQYLRENWLYNALYADSAFKCLCSKARTEKNIHTLMRFVSQDTQKDRYSAEIQITRKMRQRIDNYLYDATEEEFKMAGSFYYQKLYNCSKHARRQLFEPLFEKSNSKESVNEHIAMWENAKSESERQNLQSDLKRLLGDKDKNCYMIRTAAYSNSQELLSAITALVDQTESAFQRQFLLLEMANTTNCREYRRYIEDSFKAVTIPFHDEKSFQIGCAYCLLGHSEVIQDLFTAYYLQGVGVQGSVAKYVFHAVTKKYPAYKDTEIARLTMVCREDSKAALSLIENCTMIYGPNDETWYPVAFDKVSSNLISRNEGLLYGSRYAKAVISLFERIATVKNRDRYHDILMEIDGAEDTFPEEIRTRVRKLVQKLWKSG